MNDSVTQNDMDESRNTILSYASLGDYKHYVIFTKLKSKLNTLFTYTHTRDKIIFKNSKAILAQNSKQLLPLGVASWAGEAHKQARQYRSRSPS